MKNILDSIKSFFAETKSTYGEIAKTILFLLIAAIVFKYFIFKPFIVSGTSMEPSFHDKQYIIANQIGYFFGAPKRGDVVIFRHPDPACTEYYEKHKIMQRFTADEPMFGGTCTNFIKRVIGLPGETITIKDGKVYLRNQDNPTGVELKESYIVAGIDTLGNQTIELRKNEYYVLGDNRFPNASSDSRHWGVLSREYIVGKAFLIVIPFSDFGLIKDVTY